MVKKAKHYSKQPVGIGEINTSHIKNKDILPDDMDLTKSYSFKKLSVETKTGEGILIATLTTAFGNPSNILDGTLFVYKDTTASKVYLVVVYDDAFYLEELSAAAAE